MCPPPTWDEHYTNLKGEGNSDQQMKTPKRERVPVNHLPGPENVKPPVRKELVYPFPLLVANPLPFRGRTKQQVISQPRKTGRESRKQKALLPFPTVGCQDRAGAGEFYY